MAQLKCSDCGKLFAYCEKGSKLKPKPLCPHCVMMNEEIQCENSSCRKKGTRKNMWLDECWICQAPLCNFCSAKTIKVRGIEFSFCEKHSNYDLKELERDAERLLKEESEYE